jgi:hypothetical protein
MDPVCDSFIYTDPWPHEAFVIVIVQSITFYLVDKYNVQNSVAEVYACVDEIIMKPKRMVKS